ncbi:hypothetical protein [Prosthecobacter sp.]|uniref:hypothetical protein n=1 Tax=Prosthecobacter sp. TaxID=1965333 RepID=UPI0024889450|nr:hypothetical protein [Prosthecobacter sp.]MDI1312597.1 hypothetical protein [Prosthecobacter sp.]
MPTMKTLILTFLLTLALPFFTSAQEPEAAEVTQPAANITIKEKEFGLFEEKERGEILFTPAESVPHVLGQGYGWRLKVDTDSKSIRVKHELHLPAPAKDWGDIEEGMTVSADRKSCAYVEDCKLHQGYIFYAWEVAEDDPEGEYEVRVFIDDKLVARFKFTVKR